MMQLPGSQLLVRWTAPLLLFCATTSSALADPPILHLRVDSLDSVLADLNRVAAPTGGHLDESTILGMLAPMGISDLSWIRRDRPMVMTLSLQGFQTGGTQGLVLALPIRDADTALAGLKQGSTSHRLADDGLLYLERDGRNWIVEPRNGYLVVGNDRRSVTGFDLAQATVPGDGPPGSLALDLEVEPIAPLIQFGLMQGRQMVQQQLERSNGEADQASDLISLYFDATNDMLANTSRLQLAFEIGPAHLYIHKRITPKPGSTLAGAVKIQKGGLPSVSGLLDPDGAAILAAGQITHTPAMDQAIESYGRRYLAALEGLAALLPDTDAEAPMASILETVGDSMENWTRCVGGETATSVTFDADAEFRFTQIYGARDPQACKSMIDGFAEAMVDLPQTGAGGPLVEVTPDALTYNGVRATRQITRPWIPEGQDAEPIEDLFESLFNDGVMLTYNGVIGRFFASTGGADAEAAFKSLVDRIQGRRGKPLPVSVFQPLEVGPGLFVRVDLKRIVAGIPMPPDVPSLERLRELPAEAGRLVFGARFTDRGMDIDLAVPLGLIDFMGSSADATTAVAVDP